MLHTLSMWSDLGQTKAYSLDGWSFMNCVISRYSMITILNLNTFSYNILLLTQIVSNMTLFLTKSISWAELQNYVA